MAMGVLPQQESCMAPANLEAEPTAQEWGLLGAHLPVPGPPVCHVCISPPRGALVVRAGLTLFLEAPTQTLG